MKQKILIIDDEQPIREVLMHALAKAGYDVSTCSDGDEAIRHLEQNTVDLIITDVLMPNKDGVEVINHIRKNAGRLPIIAMSGGGQLNLDALNRICKLLGAREFINKPFLPSEMVSVVKRTLPSSEMNISIP